MKAQPVALAGVVLLFAAVQARADLDIPKWIQQPDLTAQGLDVNVTQRPVADDFLCMDPQPIVDAHIWASWKDDQVPDPSKLTFYLAFMMDVPAGAAGSPFSHPGPELWVRDFEPGEYQARLYYTHSQPVEGWYDPANTQAPYLPNNHTQVWQYNFFFPDTPFLQQGSDTQPVVYWFGLFAVVDGPEQIGWKTSIFQWNDDAVTILDDPNSLLDGDGVVGTVTFLPLEYPIGHPLEGDSLDMAFALTTPEPATLSLLALGGAILIHHRRRPKYKP